VLGKQLSAVPVEPGSAAGDLLIAAYSIIGTQEGITNG